MTERSESAVDPSQSTGSPGGGTIRVVGTAHVSHDSVEEVKQTIDEERPDVVAVELDEGRYRQLQGETPDDLDASDLLRGNTVFQLLAYWMLAYVQTRLGERFDIEPGADMLAAIESAEALGLDVALVDRDIQMTIQRFWARLSFFQKLKLVGTLFGALFGLGMGEEEELDVEDLTDGDVVTAMLEEFRRFSPGGAEALIDERDAFIAHKLVALRATGKDVVAVVGAGHKAGIEHYLEHPGDLPPMETLVGSASRGGIPWFKLFGYLFSVGFLLFFILLAMAGVRDAFLLQLFAAWFLVNAVFAFSLAKLAGARWTSAGVGGGVAWLTSVNPLLAPGWFAGYVELRYTSVNIGDITTLNELLSDEETPIRDLISQMFDVPLFRLIMIVAMTNVGSIIASVLFGLFVLPWLGAEIGGVGQIPDVMMEGARESVRVITEVVT